MLARHLRWQYARPAGGPPSCSPGAARATGPRNQIPGAGPFAGARRHSSCARKKLSPPHTGGTAGLPAVFLSARTPPVLRSYAPAVLLPPFPSYPPTLLRSYAPALLRSCAPPSSRRSPSCAPTLLRSCAPPSSRRSPSCAPTLLRSYAPPSSPPPSLSPPPASAIMSAVSFHRMPMALLPKERLLIPRPPVSPRLRGSSCTPVVRRGHVLPGHPYPLRRAQR